MDRPFSQASENNKAPILSIIQNHFSNINYVLEVGSGTGQHAVHFAKEMPHLIWQPTDRPENIPGIKQWLAWADLNNIQPPLVLDVNLPSPVNNTPAIYSANTLHIMSWSEVELFFQMVKEILSFEGMLCLYGPFNINGCYTSESNAKFDQWLKAKNPLSGIRDLESIQHLAVGAGLEISHDYAMPANNRFLIFTKLNLQENV